jgi:hypothetical protein
VQHGQHARSVFLVPDAQVLDAAHLLLVREDAVETVVDARRLFGFVDALESAVEELVLEFAGRCGRRSGSN